MFDDDGYAESDSHDDDGGSSYNDNGRPCTYNYRGDDDECSCDDDDDECAESDSHDDDGGGSYNDNGRPCTYNYGGDDDECSCDDDDGSDTDYDHDSFRGQCTSLHLGVF